MHRAHFTPCLHGVYIVHTLPVGVLREAVKMSSAFPRPTISAVNGCAIIAAFPLKRLHHRMRPVDADLVYTSTGQVALTILLENGGSMLIVELTRLLLQWLCFDDSHSGLHTVKRMASSSAEHEPIKLRSGQNVNWCHIRQLLIEHCQQINKCCQVRMK